MQHNDNSKMRRHQRRQGIRMLPNVVAAAVAAAVVFQSQAVSHAFSTSDKKNPSFVLDIDHAQTLHLPSSISSVISQMYPPLQSVPCRIINQCDEDDDNNIDTIDRSESTTTETQANRKELTELIIPPNVETLYEFYVKTQQDDRDPSWAVVSPTAMALTNYLIEQSQLVCDRNVVEVGAGIGLVGLIAASLGAQSVLLTDRQPLALHFAMSWMATTIYQGSNIGLVGCW
jgi:Lysine methyltransferase